MKSGVESLSTFSPKHIPTSVQVGAYEPNIEYSHDNSYPFHRPMRRRNYLRTVGSLPLITGGVAGCLTNITSETTSGNTDGVTEQTLTAQEIGKGWKYTESGSPTVADSGTIVASYRATDPYSRTVKLRLWPCEGETLEELGSCSLGNLPKQKRTNGSIETATRTLGKNTFLWWDSVATDIEVVTVNNVFRLTHTPGTESNQEIQSRDARVEEVVKIARLQTENLTQRNSTEIEK